MDSTASPRKANLLFYVREFLEAEDSCAHELLRKWLQEKPVRKWGKQDWAGKELEPSHSLIPWEL